MQTSKGACCQPCSCGAATAGLAVHGGIIIANRVVSDGTFAVSRVLGVPPGRWAHVHIVATHVASDATLDCRLQGSLNPIGVFTSLGSPVTLSSTGQTAVLALSESSWQYVRVAFSSTSETPGPVIYSAAVHFVPA